MSTGAIFARGSCRALTWVLALGAMAVVFAGEAVAQPTKITVSPSKVEVEEGGVASFNVSLDKVDDTNDTTVAVATSRNTNGSNFVYTVSGAVWVRSGDNLQSADIVFASGSKGPVLVSVSSPNDDDATDGQEVLSLTASGLDPANVTITQDDNDQVRVTISPRSLTIAEGGEDTYTVVLGSAPAAGADVTVTARVTNVNAAVSVVELEDSTYSVTGCGTDFLQWK